MRTNSMLFAMSLVLASGPVLAAVQLPPTNPPRVIEPEPDKASALNQMVGKQVLGTSREFLGTVVSVDGQAGDLQMKTPDGPTVPVSLSRVMIEGDHVRATISKGDVIALIRQTGQSGVFEVKAK